MKHDDALRHTLHDPDYWLPEQPPGILARALVWLAALGVSTVMVVVGLGGIVFLGWLLAGLLS